MLGLAAVDGEREREWRREGRGRARNIDIYALRHSHPWGIIKNTGSNQIRSPPHPGFHIKVDFAVLEHRVSGQLNDRHEGGACETSDCGLACTSCRQTEEEIDSRWIDRQTESGRGDKKRTERCRE